MHQFDQFKQQVNLLYATVRLQKGVRLGLRALWMGVAGILVGWAIQALTGLLPNPLTWFGIGLAVAVVPIVGVVAALYPVLTDLPPPKSWIYALDRRLHFRQQLSTAWEVVQKDQRGPVADVLVTDLVGQMPRAREKVLANGWYRKVELVASTIMTLLALALLLNLLIQFVSPPPTTTDSTPQNSPQQQSLSPQGQPDQQQPNGQGQQPGNQAGQNGAQNGQSADNPGADQPGSANGDQQQQNGAAGNTDQNNGASSDSSAGQQPGSVADALKQLGQALSQQAGTYDLGQALENLQMNPAADALQDLKNELKELSPESRKNLSQALQDAAKNLDQANQPGLAQDMQDAANAAQDPKSSPDQGGQALDQLSQDLRQLDQAMQGQQNGGSQGGQGQSANAGQSQPPADRLPDENGQMELPLDNPQNSGLLSPARPDAAGEGTAQGSLDANRPQGSSAAQNPLLPNSMLWKWRHVVSQYFQR